MERIDKLGCLAQRLVGAARMVGLSRDRLRGEIVASTTYSRGRSCVNRRVEISSSSDPLPNGCSQSETVWLEQIAAVGRQISEPTIVYVKEEPRSNRVILTEQTDFGVNENNWSPIWLGHTNAEGTSLRVNIDWLTEREVLVGEVSLVAKQVDEYLNIVDGILSRTVKR